MNWFGRKKPEPAPDFADLCERYLSDCGRPNPDEIQTDEHREWYRIYSKLRANGWRIERRPTREQRRAELQRELDRLTSAIVESEAPSPPLPKGAI